jgi:hypothetical protein
LWVFSRILDVFFVTSNEGKDTMNVMIISRLGIELAFNLGVIDILRFHFLVHTLVTNQFDFEGSHRVEKKCCSKKTRKMPESRASLNSPVPASTFSNLEHFQTKPPPRHTSQNGRSKETNRRLRRHRFPQNLGPRRIRSKSRRPRKQAKRRIQSTIRSQNRRKEIPSSSLHTPRRTRNRRPHLSPQCWRSSGKNNVSARGRCVREKREGSRFLL